MSELFLINGRRVEFDCVGLGYGLGRGQSWPSVAQYGTKRTVWAVEAPGWQEQGTGVEETGTELTFGGYWFGWCEWTT